ncbi:SOS response-associated peptidase [Methylacidiphilum caldifontis]|uniref:Abasic site processing protein n=1 Tax=Methylacidiphilum caldifontis TaxID=2795386 RepID=A0A4Y8PHJ6_9BACT|nr:SOS response-associated peptidase [Methylacidiphilum caldifontis]TFE72915.1 hypothetical protein A7Q10_03320 [Methylacidiphilum caldifontis]
MCGRFSLHTPPKVIKQVFNLELLPEIQPRYNIAPSTPILVVRKIDGKNRADLLRWGLIPHWAKEKKSSYSLINARAETVSTKSVFRESFKRRRCLIPADGFYEWKKLNGKKEPWYITIPDQEVFAFAGLWDHWEGPGETIESTTIIVTEACDKLRHIHDRMPVIVDRIDFERWLVPVAGEEKKELELLRPWQREISLHRVSSAVNKATAEGQELIKAV